MTQPVTPRVAIIGSGIAGLTAAYLLHNKQATDRSGEPVQYDITLFESAGRLGGHTATIDVEEADQSLSIDTGFIVYNDWTYPNFIRLLDELGVASQPTDMSFSVSCSATGLEYSGSNINTLFAQRKNLLNTAFVKMLWDIVRFNRQAVADLEAGCIEPGATLGQYLAHNQYQGLFASHYLVPMCAAIWSASSRAVLDFPLQFFVSFFKNHGLLNLVNRPQWRVIRGGSRSYIDPLVAGFADRICLSTAVTRVQRRTDGVILTVADGRQYQFDQVVFACHSDQALALLADPSPEESQLLSAIPYRNNSVVLHTDTRLLPRNRRTWSAWNYLLSAGEMERPVLTYNMNILQSLPSDTTYCVTLNASEHVDPARVIGRFDYAHPQFSLASMEAQNRWEEINGVNRSWYCGAYWGNGFHEDGVVSGMKVAEGLGVRWS